MKTMGNLKKTNIVTNNGSVMTVIGERALNNEEIRRAIELKNKLIPAEDKAYDYFPMSIKARIERNVPVAFANHTAFYPDFLLTEEKVLIEIDEWRHDYQPRKDMDIHRDQIFRDYGFITIRIKEKELNGKVKFRMRLIEAFNNIEHQRKDGYFGKIKSELLCMAA